MSENSNETTDPQADADLSGEATPDATEPSTTSDGITAWSVYNTTLGQFVGGVTRGKKPTTKEAKATLEAYGMGSDKHELRQV